jgi:hypothetical protein
MAFMLSLVGCQVKDKHEKAMQTSNKTPPWDSAHFTPKSLEGYVYTGPESTFNVFKEMAFIDSQSSSQLNEKADPEAIDTLRISQLFDTTFLFPENPEATMAYGYDDSFRDDTLFRHAYGNGLFIEDHPCATTYILSGEFLHPARWLNNGLSESQIVSALGTPENRQPNRLSYQAKYPGTPPPSNPEDTLSTAAEYNTFDVFEGVNFYFKDDSLFAAKLHRSQPCH